MIYRLERNLVQASLMQAAVAEIGAEWPAWQNPRERRSVICYLNPNLKRDGSNRPEFERGPRVADLQFCVERALAFLDEKHGAFNTIAVNRNWATPMHRDSEARPRSIVGLAVAKIGEVHCPTMFRDPEEDWEWEEELGTGDLVLFQGAEMEHGNPKGITGSGERWEFVFSAR